MCRLEVAQLLRVRGVRCLAVGDRERGLPRAGPDPEHGFQARLPAFAEHRGAGETLLGNALPAEADLVARAERLETGEARDLGREADPRQLPSITADLVDAKGRHDLLDALPERFDEIAERVRIRRRDRVF